MVSSVMSVIDSSPSLTALGTTAVMGERENAYYTKFQVIDVRCIALRNCS